MVKISMIRIFRIVVSIFLIFSLLVSPSKLIIPDAQAGIVSFLLSVGTYFFDKLSEWGISKLCKRFFPKYHKDAEYILNPIIKNFPALLKPNTPEARDAAKMVVKALENDYQLRNEIEMRFNASGEARYDILKKLRNLEDRIEENTRGIERVAAELNTKVSQEDFENLVSRVDQLTVGYDKNVFIKNRHLFSKHLKIFINNATWKINFDGIRGSCAINSDFCESLISLPGALGCYVPSSPKKKYAYCDMFEKPPQSPKTDINARYIYNELKVKIRSAIPDTWDFAEKTTKASSSENFQKYFKNLNGDQKSIFKPDIINSVYSAQEKHGNRSVELYFNRIEYEVNQSAVNRIFGFTTGHIFGRILTGISILNSIELRIYPE